MLLKDQEEFIGFLNRWKIKGSKVMLFPRCSVVFGKEATKGLEDFKPQTPRRNHRDERRVQYGFEKICVPYLK